MGKLVFNTSGEKSFSLKMVLAVARVIKLPEAKLSRFPGMIIKHPCALAAGISAGLKTG